MVVPSSPVWPDPERRVSSGYEESAALWPEEKTEIRERTHAYEDTRNISHALNKMTNHCLLQAFEILSGLFPSVLHPTVNIF